MTGVPAVLCALAIGFVFGFAMDKAKVTVPSVLREQMVFRSEVMVGHAHRQWRLGLSS